MTPPDENLVLFPKKKKSGKYPRIRSNVSDRQMFWLAGILEGEGSFLHGPPSDPNTPRIQCQMTDGDVIERIASILGVKPIPIRKVAKSHYKPTYIATLKGVNARDMMIKLRPLMSKRRQEQIDRALASYNPATGYDSYVARRVINDAEVESIRKRHEDGESLRAIAKYYGVCHETIRLRVHVGQPISYRENFKFTFESETVSW